MFRRHSRPLLFPYQPRVVSSKEPPTMKGAQAQAQLSMAFASQHPSSQHRVMGVNRRVQCWLHMRHCIMRGQELLLLHIGMHSGSQAAVPMPTQFYVAAAPSAACRVCRQTPAASRTCCTAAGHGRTKTALPHAVTRLPEHQYTQGEKLELCTWKACSAQHQQNGRKQRKSG